MNLKEFAPVRRVIGRQGGRAAAVAGALLAETAFRCYTPVAVGVVVDQAAGLRRPLAVYYFALLGVSVVGVIAAGMARDLAANRLSNGILEDVREAAYRADREGDAAALTADLARFGAWLGEIVGRGLQPAVEAVIATLLVFWLDWRAGAVTALIWFFTALASGPMEESLKAAGDGLEQEEDNLRQTFAEAVRDRSVVRAFQLETRRTEEFGRQNQALTRVAGRVGQLRAVAFHLTRSGYLVLLAVVLSLCAWRVSNAELSAGSLVAVQLLAVLVAADLKSAREFMAGAEAMSAVWRRLAARMVPREPAVKSGTRILPPFHAEITFLRVSCSPSAGVPVRAISASIPKGRHVAFVGPSGCGKSAVLRLLPGLETPASGTIAIDGYDLPTLEQGSLRAQLGAVLQDNVIFDATLLDNIGLRRAGVSADAAARAATEAGLAELIAKLPSGMETLLGRKGVRLSDLDAQRVTLARALAGTPAILLLDEFSSSLDPADEDALTRTIQALAPGRTIVSASHRLSSAADADLIYVMDEGRIVEQGTHFELLAMHGRYAELWQKQAGFRFSADGRHVDVEVERLRRLPVLEKLSKDVLSELAPFFATENYPAGRDIVRQNDPGDKFFIIVRGRVEVWRTDEPSGATGRVAVLQDGDYFGEITLITGFPRTATVRTATPTTCISLERAQFIRLLERLPELSQEISETAMKRFQASSRAAKSWQ